MMTVLVMVSMVVVVVRTLLCKFRSEAHLINNYIVDDCNDAMRYHGGVFCW